MDLRPYQRAAVDATWQWIADNDGHPLIVVPTGGGKSLIMAELIRMSVQQWGARVILTSHVKELLAQNGATLARHWPNAPYAYWSAGLGQKRVAQITIAGIQSAADCPAMFGVPDLLMIDEAHLVSPKDGTRYRSFINALLGYNRNLRVIGLTATAYRMDSGLLHSGEGSLFTDIAYQCDLVGLIRDGYLCPLVPKGGKTKADLSAVRTRGGEFVPADLSKAVDRDDLVEGALDEVMQYAGDRHHRLYYCVDVKHAEHVAASLRARGLAAACVHGSTKAAERDRILAEFKAGRITDLTNCDILTTGFDAPMIDCLVMLRPTKSVGLYVQICGRGMRMHDSKVDTLVLDFAGNVARHGPIDQIRVKSKREAGDGPVEVMPMKQCEECGALSPISARACGECGNEFPFDQQMHGAQADDRDLIAGIAKPRDFPVVGVRYSRHEKPGKPASMRVDYYTNDGLRRFSEWVCIEHDGYAKKHAVKWFWKRGMVCPESVDAALALKIPQPATIKVRTEGKYERVIDATFAREAVAA